MKQNKKYIIGVVTQAAMKDAVVVSVSRKKMNPIYKKSYTINKKIKARKNNFELFKGDVVRISEVRPVSRDIHFEVSKKEGK